jgi:putative flippase GtrA
VFSVDKIKGQFSRFITVGVFNTALGYAIIFFAMYVLHWSPEASNALGYGIGLISSFLLSKIYTFRSSGNGYTEFFYFLLMFGIAYAANFLALYVMVRMIFFHPGLSQIFAGVIYIFVSYWLNSRYVFTNQRIDKES